MREDPQEMVVIAPDKIVQVEPTVIEKEAIHPYRWRALTVWTIIVSVVLVLFVVSLQRSRVESCQRTYDGIHQVFKPFFRPPSEQTAQQKEDQAKFLATIARLKKGCEHQ